MRLIIVLVTGFMTLWCSVALAKSPPFTMITITGVTESRYNRVSLFESGSSKEPLKTAYISSYGGQYSIDVNLPSDMRKKDQYYFTDLRFWDDKNENGIRDEGEIASACHFIMWIPSSDELYMQVYKGTKYPIDSSVLYYHHKK